MVYVTLGKNRTGQLIVACPHIQAYQGVDMYLFPDGSAIYEVRGMGHLLFKPSKMTIVMWCEMCFEDLKKRKLLPERPGSAIES